MGWGGGGPCDYCVSLSPFDLDLGTLDFGTSDSGLTTRFMVVEMGQHFILVSSLFVR